MPEHGTWVGRTLRFARMAGTSTAAPDAAPWVTDFLNAAYYARPAGGAVASDDLRLAFTILTTRWWRKGPRRLHLTDLPRFHRAFGRQRISARGGSGGSTREDLLAGAERLLGAWFAEGYGDPARTGWGIVFATPRRARGVHPRGAAAVRAARPDDPARSPRRATSSGSPTRPCRCPTSRSPSRASPRPSGGPTRGSDHGRFTPLRTGGLPGQTFEIEVVAGAGTRHPLITRGYVTATRRLRTRATRRGSRPPSPASRPAWRTWAAPSPPASRRSPSWSSRPHAGHFIGPAVSNLLLTAGPGGGTLRDVGVWEPMAFPQRTAYRLGRPGGPARLLGRGGGGGQHAPPARRPGRRRRLTTAADQRAARTASAGATNAKDACQKVRRHSSSSTTSPSTRRTGSVPAGVRWGRGRATIPPPVMARAMSASR